MKAEDKKLAIAAYKKRKVDAGIYAIRCAATGEVWVGQARDFGAARNRLDFALRHGSAPRTLQDAWRAHGADALAFEAVERLDEKALGLFPAQVLRDRQAHWLAKLAARAI